MTPSDALSRSYERLRLVVQRAAEDVVRDRDEASDVASETFLALIEQGPADEAVHLAWLRTTARRRALNRLRRLHRHVPLGDHDIAVDDREPLDGVRELIASALVRLPERDRQALESRVVREESYNDLANHLGVSSEQAHLIVHRAGIRLRREVVRGLAEAHGAPETCTRSLIRRFAESREGAAHVECKPCLSVGEEIAALRTAVSNLAVLPLGRPALSLLDRMAVAAQRLGGLIDRPRGQAIAAALALAVSLGSTGVPSVRPSPIPRPATTGIPASGTLAELAASRPASGLPAPGIPRSTGQGIQEVRRATDPSGDEHVLPRAPTLTHPLWIPDAIGTGNRRADLDATSFEVGTLAEDGRTAGLGFSLQTVGLPLEHGGRFTVDWRFRSVHQCSATLTVTRREDEDPVGSVLTSCTLNTLSPTPTEEEIQVPVRVSGHTMEIAVPFGAMGNLGRALHHSGAWLTTMTAATATAASSIPVVPTTDRIPDSGSLTYAIG
ncbi:MAG: sigma-70 family RNA polymerase sigma factor [Acidobacteria bacterium]|nr:sigma-70 family RNA polymerase sigma factor [Acidobacteriota bacterium]